jgi:hypothetical protein
LKNKEKKTCLKGINKNENVKFKGEETYKNEEKKGMLLAMR